MKIKYPLINGLIQLVLIIVYAFLGFHKNFYINLTILILFVNVSSYLTMSANFKKNNIFLPFFFIFSFLVLSIGLGVTVFVFHLSENDKLLDLAANMIQYYDISGAIKICLTYFIFSLLPSFLVLSFFSSKRRVKPHSVKRHKRRKK
jgi:hypothetical protein